MKQQLVLFSLEVEMNKQAARAATMPYVNSVAALQQLLRDCDPYGSEK